LKQLLLVDDHAVVRSGLRLILESGGWETVHEAATGPQAIAVLQAQPCKFVIVDARLEGEDGVELVAQIRIQSPKLPILVLSMYSEPARVRSAIRAGANGYLLKDASGDEVLAAVQCLRNGGLYLDRRVASSFLSGLWGLGPSDTLAQRNRIILEAIQSGHSNQQIADQLNLSLSSVKALLHDLYLDHGVKDRMSLLVMVNKGNLA
jgi:DNA-binding NarL/FixJ family response regulator